MIKFKFLAALLIYAVFSFALAIPVGIFSSAPFVFWSESMYVLDKVFLYLLVYCSPYVLSYFALSNVFKKLSFLGPALVVYVAYSSYLFFNDMYFARGAEVDPKPLYFILLYAPPLLVVLGILIAKRKAAEPSRPAS